MNNTVREKCENIVRLLIKNKLKITSCESCTGGLFASFITSVSGSSECFEGSFVTYSNRIKNKITGVKEETLLKYGAVSEECVLEMAENSRKMMDSDISIAISGIAGPSGGTEEKPVGLVFICICADNYIKSYRNVFSGDRDEVRQSSVIFALDLVANYIENL